MDMILEACKKGSIVAEGKCCFEGWGRPKNVDRGVQLYMEAARCTINIDK